MTGRRRFFAALYPDRCAATVILKDRSEAQCMRRRTMGHLCTQHAKIAARCTCPTTCDCQDPIGGLVSNECPIHNENPYPALDCPVHGEEGK